MRSSCTGLADYCIDDLSKHFGELAGAGGKQRLTMD